MLIDEGKLEGQLPPSAVRGFWVTKPGSAQGPSFSPLTGSDHSMKASGGCRPRPQTRPLFRPLDLHPRTGGNFLLWLQAVSLTQPTQLFCLYTSLYEICVLREWKYRSDSLYSKASIYVLCKVGKSRFVWLPASSVIKSMFPCHYIPPKHFNSIPFLDVSFSTRARY